MTLAMGIKGWARMLAEKGFVPDQAAITSCCSGSLWRDTALGEMVDVEAIPPNSTLHIDGNGMAFFIHQIAYARQIDQALLHKRRSEKICAVPQEITTAAVHSFLPNFLSLETIHNVIKEFIEQLQSQKMKLIVYWDGDARHVFKQETDAKRTDRRNDEASNLHQYCLHGRLPARSSVCQWEYEFPKTRLFKTQIIHTLTQLGVEMKECPEEADPFMARLASGDEQSYILGNDTDFCAFRNVQYIPFSTMHASKRGPLTACVVRRRDIADRLGIDDDLMVELAILCGNDYVPDPSQAGLSFYARDFDEKIEFLRDVEPGFRLETNKEDMETVLAFVRASYELESLDDFPLNDDGSNDGSREDVGSVLGDLLNVTLDLESSNVEIALEMSLLRVRPSEDKSIIDAVIRCIEHYIDINSHLEYDDDCCIRPIHVEALRKLKVDEGLSTMPVAWRPDWKDVVAVQLIEKCIDASFEMNATSPLAKVRPPHRVFNQYMYHVLLAGMRDPTKVLKEEVPEIQVVEAKPVVPLKLPIDEHEDEILDMIANNRISVIQGETGCGKSSRIPAMLLKKCRDVKLFISQPRRIAAKALVERLRDSEPELRDLIALRMGHGHREYESSTTRAWFVTTGYLVRLLANNRERFDDVTHLVIDEVHERSVDTDILCLLCRRLLSYNTNIRLVLMSATLAAKMYQEYFDIPTPPLKVGARRFPVEEVYLDDLAARLNLPGNMKKTVATLTEACNATKCRAPPNSQGMEKLHALACHLALVAGSPGSSVLIFVPGMMDIVSITERIEQLYVPGVRYTTFPIHSDIPFDDQMNVFAPTEADEVKIIVATNAAESSVTLPDVDTVICLGLCKQIVYNEMSHRQMLTATWISKASATQRAGRTGRLRPGTCFRLYTRQNYNEHMEDFEPGEILRIPLDSVILMLKEMLQDEEVNEVLQDCIEPPNTTTIERSFLSLYESHFITSPSGDCDITQLGLFVSALGVDLALGSLVGLGIQFGVAAEVIQLASILSFPTPPWIMSNPLVHDAKSFNDMTKRTYTSRCHFDANLFSEPLAAMNLLWEYEAVKNDARKTNAFCQRHGLVIARLRRLLNTCSNLRLRVATYFNLDEALLRVAEPPSHMPHAKITVLRVLQAWVFCDSVIECCAYVRNGDPVATYALECLPKSDNITYEHLEQVLSKERHRFSLSGYVKAEQHFRIKYLDGGLLCGRYDERFLSYATEKGISLVWLWDKDYMIVYVADELFASSKFEHLVEKLRERLLESESILEPNHIRRGVGERSCGRWKLSSTGDVSLSENDGRVVFHRFCTGYDDAPKKKLANMRKFHLNNFLKDEPSVRGFACEFISNKSVFTLFGCGEVTGFDASDLLLESAQALNFKKSAKMVTKQTIVFESAPNAPLADTRKHNGDSSWDRPLFDCIPEGARLLAILASSRRRGDHGFFLQATGPDGNESEDMLTVHLDRSKTKIQGRWKRVGSGSDVYTTENSVPATALSRDGENLYCVASNTLEIKGGGLRVEGLTLLPPGRLFMLLTRASFGLSCGPLDPDSSEMDDYDRIQQAHDFHEATRDLGEELRCFPEKARQLCSLFNGVDGYEGEIWDIDSNPFTHDNYAKVSKPLRGYGSRVHTPVRMPSTSNTSTATTNKLRPLSTKEARIMPTKLYVHDAAAMPLVATTDMEPNGHAQGLAHKLTRTEKRKKKKDKVANVSLKKNVNPAQSITAMKNVAQNVSPAKMHSLFASDLLQSPQVSSSDPPSSNILAHIVRLYRQSKMVPGQVADETTLVNPGDWLLYKVKVNGATYYQAKFQSYGIKYAKVSKDVAQVLPSWFSEKVSFMRPTAAADALSCLPFQFRDACDKSMKTVKIEKKRALVFDSIEMAVRLEASFWLQRQFLSPPVLTNWYEQDLTAMLNKLLARS
ncbi:hypothetical protein MPSEU_000300700 [Mayamaea pseudoterrestris]|nr:hypothetical protein MPSEU_000300700 [Mayamaea pseudoterrestris]